MIHGDERKRQTESIRRYFKKLGFEEEIAAIYQALSIHGAQTISELARTSHVERTRIYRLTDTLLSSGLVEVETEYKRSIYKAAPIMNVQIILAKKEQELRELQSGLDELTHLLKKSTAAEEGTHVQFYSGADGARQFFWNETKAEDEMLCMLNDVMQLRTGNRFFERWIKRCNERNIRFRGIVNDHFMNELEGWNRTHQNERLEYWNSRILKSDIFPLTHSTVVYDSVTAHYSWSTEEVFALEIYNKEIADSQRRYFELLWSEAVPVHV